MFEFDKLIRSIYTLRYLRDPQLQRNVHRSQNRIESYHQLRSTIAQRRLALLRRTRDTVLSRRAAPPAPGAA